MNETQFQIFLSEVSSMSSEQMLRLTFQLEEVARNAAIELKDLGGDQDEVDGFHAAAIAYKRASDALEEI